MARDTGIQEIINLLGAQNDSAGVVIDIDGSGLATLTEQEAQTTLLTTIDGDTGAILTALANLSTAANQATLNGYVDTIESKLDLLQTKLNDTKNVLDAVAADVASLDFLATYQLDELDRDLITPPAASASANSPVTITINAVSNRRFVIKAINCGYTATPTGGMLTITDGGTARANIPITAAGAAPIKPDVIGTVNTAMTITLAAGGTGVVGHLSVSYYEVA